MANRLSYKDYRRIRPGDYGYTPEKEKAKNYYSPTSQDIISTRQYQKGARGQTYTEFVKERVSKGIKPKQYRSKSVREREKRQEELSKTNRGKYQVRQEKKYQAAQAEDAKKDRLQGRADYLQRKYLKKLGVKSFNDLSNDEIGIFWDNYHELFYDRDTDYSYYADFFDVDLEYFDEVEYGITP